MVGKEDVGLVVKEHGACKVEEDPMVSVKHRRVQFTVAVQIAHARKEPLYDFVQLVPMSRHTGRLGERRLVLRLDLDGQRREHAARLVERIPLHETRNGLCIVRHFLVDKLQELLLEPLVVRRLGTLALAFGCAALATGRIRHLPLSVDEPRTKVRNDMVRGVVPDHDIHELGCTRECTRHQ